LSTLQQYQQKYHSSKDLAEGSTSKHHTLPQDMKQQSLMGPKNSASLDYNNAGMKGTNGRVTVIQRDRGNTDMLNSGFRNNQQTL